MNEITIEQRTNQLMNSKDSYERQKAARELGQLKLSNTVPLLIEALNDQDGKVRQAAAYALGEIGDQRAVEPLTKAFISNNDKLRREAQQALEKLGRVCITRLVEALTHERERVRRAAGRTLIDIDPDWANSNEAKAAIPHLIAAIKASENIDRKLSNIHLLKKIIDPTWTKTEAAKELIPTFITVLKTRGTWPPDWITLADLLGEIGDARAVDALLEGLKGSVEVQEATAKALVSIGDKRAVVPLATAFLLAFDGYYSRHSCHAMAKALMALGWNPSIDNMRAKLYIWLGFWESLVNLGEAAVEPLIQMFDFGNPYMRENAARVLGNIGDNRAIWALERLIKFDNYSVREGPDYPPRYRWPVREAARNALAKLSASSKKWVFDSEALSNVLRISVGR